MIISGARNVELLREGGKKLAYTLSHVASKICPGITTIELDQIAERLIREAGGRPSFKNYRTEGTQKPYPASLCVSVNDEVVHGIPDARILQDGDIVGLDIGMEYKGFFTDMAVTIAVGTIDARYEKLIRVTKKALDIAIESARFGGRVGDIGEAVEAYVEGENLEVVRELVGHGVGRAVHEDPEIPNWGKRGTGEQLVEGMVLALEPMVTEGSGRIKVSKGGWVWSTVDGKRAAHFEHTILITKKGTEIITE